MNYFADKHNYEIACCNSNLASENIDVHDGSPRVAKTLKNYEDSNYEQSTPNITSEADANRQQRRARRLPISPQQCTETNKEEHRLMPARKSLPIRSTRKCCDTRDNALDSSHTKLEPLLGKDIRDNVRQKSHERQESAKSKLRGNLTNEPPTLVKTAATATPETDRR